MKLSVTLITYNEEQNLARALESVTFADEVVIVDSFSTDKTKSIAKKYGAIVVDSEFLGYGQQKNLAESYATGDWILSLDADEEVSPELKNSIQNIISKEDNQTFDVYELNRRTSYCGQWIYHGGWYPDILARLYKKGKARWTEPQVHELLIPTRHNSIGKLKGHLNHYSFPTIASQVATNIKYAKLGAKALVQEKKSISLLRVLIKPIGKFFECYLLKGGLLDGRAGLFIAINAAYSIFLKYLFAYKGELHD